MPLQGWLWLDDCEILNDARFEANMQRYVGCGAGTRFISWLKPVSDQLSWNPCRRDAPERLDYSDPLLAPWYDPSRHDESTSFYGFWVLETTFDSTHAREIDQRGTTRAGANFSRLRRQHREIAYTVLLGAENDYGLQWGFDWLSEKLANCNAMRLSNAMIRMSGAQPDAIWQDLWMLEGMGLTDPLKWGEAPLPLSACRMRQATFVISAADPDRRSCPQRLLDPAYFYDPGTVPTACMDGAQWLCGPFPDERICVHMPGPGQLGTTDAIVTIQAGSNGTPALRVYGALDRWGWPCADPRLELCMNIRIDGLFPHEQLIVDSTHQRVWMNSPATGFENTDGIKYLIPPEEGIPKYIQVSNCDWAWLWIEPLNACGLDDEATITIDYVHRVMA